MTAQRVSPPVPKPITGLVFVVFWGVAIVAWCLVNLSTDHGVRGLIADVGIVFACAGTAALSVSFVRGWIAILALSVVGVVLFAAGDLFHVQILVYFLRILGPAIAVIILPTLKLVNSMKVFA